MYIPYMPSIPLWIVDIPSSIIITGKSNMGYLDFNPWDPSMDVDIPMDLGKL